jgi:cytidine deaminase
MEHRQLTINITTLSSINELSESDRHLVEAAFEAATRAYAPYSGFTVGAALRLANNEVITGNNQENAAYPSGLCAERVALFYASAKYPKVAVDCIAVVARAGGKDLDEAVAPCGACRQVMAEYEHHQEKPMRVIMATEKAGAIVVEGMESLLPIAFVSKYLIK